VEDLSDTQANIRLISSNQQEGNSPLDIGLNAIETVAKSNGGSNSKGQGLAAYADSIGKSKQLLGQWMGAGKVYINCKDNFTVDCKAYVYHLYETSKADPRAWPCLVERPVMESWTVSDCKHWEGITRLSAATTAISPPRVKAGGLSCAAPSVS
jgi:hypothetical protein